MLTSTKYAVPHISSAHRSYNISTKESQNKSLRMKLNLAILLFGNSLLQYFCGILGKSFIVNGECPKWKVIFKNLWSVFSLPSPLHVLISAPSVHLSLRAKQAKNHSKTFHLLFRPSACRQATAWSTCTHCTARSFLKPGLSLRLPI